MSQRIITVANEELLTEANKTSLSAYSTAGSDSYSVYSIKGFAINQPLLTGEFGQEGSEKINTDTSAPSGTTITLYGTTTKDHPKDTPVYVLPYDQVEFSHADTIAGDKTVLTTIDVSAESKETTYVDSGTSGGGYYFTRYYNSITAAYADYSDPIPYGGFGSNTVAYIINLAMSELHKDYSVILTYEMLISEVNSCLRFIRGKLKKWSNVQEFNYEIDATLAEDDYTWTLPTTYYDKNSNRSCLQVWIEGEDNLTYVDKQEFDDLDRDTSSGTPKYFTIYDGSLYITPKVGLDYVGDSLYMDFYTDITEVDSDADEISLARHDMVKHWIKWAIKNITERNGTPDFNDGDFMMFQSILADAIRRESSGQKNKLMPKINGISYSNIIYSEE